MRRLWLLWALSIGCWSKPPEPEALATVDAPAGAVDSPGSIAAAPRVFSSPGPAPTFFVSWATPLTVTLATDDPRAIIYYSTDGVPPSMSSTHAQTPVQVPVSSSIQLSYFAAQGSATSSIVTETVGIDPSNQSLYGYVVTGTTLDGTSPVVMADADQILTVAVGIVHVWATSGMPQNNAQLVYSVDASYQGCVYDGAWSPWPGVTVTNRTFTVKAPKVSGVHEVRVTHIYDGTCAAALIDPELPTRPTAARIGVIIVR